MTECRTDIGLLINHWLIGFGRRMSFTEELEVPPGFSMNFKDALHVVSGGVLVKLAVPKWALGLTQRFRDVDRAFNELGVSMISLVLAP